MVNAARYRVKHVGETPRGYRVRSKRSGRHVLRIAYPPGRRRKGSGSVVEILHPREEKNPRCKVCEKVQANPSELVIFGNPAGGVGNHRPGCPCKFCKTVRGAAGNPDRGKQRAARDRAARIRAARLNPRGVRRKRGRNPEPETDQAVKLYEIFHGKQPAEIIERHRSTAIRKDYTALGALNYLVVITPVGEEVKFDFDGDGVKLASSPDGRQLYLIGGNQNLTACLTADSLQKDFLDLGECVEVAYTARKIHTNYTPIEWFHKFGEEPGSTRPQLAYEKLQKQIYFIGGQYRIDTNVAISPGIEN